MRMTPRELRTIPRARMGVFADAAAINKKVHLLWFGAGTAEERMLKPALAMHETLQKAGIRNVFYQSPGTAHEWQTWRRDLHEFVPYCLSGRFGGVMTGEPPEGIDLDIGASDRILPHWKAWRRTW